MTQSLSVKSIVDQRADLLSKITSEIKKLNTQFQKNPMKINSKVINELFSNLEQINGTIETKKQELQVNRNKWCCLANVKKVTWIVFGICLTANVINGILNGINAHFTSSCDINMTGIWLLTAGIIVSLALEGSLAPLIQSAYAENAESKYLLHVMEVKKQGEELRQFIKSFEEFKKTLKTGKDETKQKQVLAKVVRKLDKVPLEHKQFIPSREYWLSHLIKMLPDSHPLKEIIKQLKKDALAVEKKKKHHSHQNDRSFEGEKLSVGAITTPAPISDRIAVNPSFVRRWETLEKELGLELDCLQVDELGISKKGQHADSITTFGAVLPALEEEISIEVMTL